MPLQEVHGKQDLAEQKVAVRDDFDLELKNRPGRSKKVEDKNWRYYLRRTQTSQTFEESTSLGIDLTAVGKRLKLLGIIQKYAL